MSQNQINIEDFWLAGQDYRQHTSEILAKVHSGYSSQALTPAKGIIIAMIHSHILHCVDLNIERRSPVICTSHCHIPVVKLRLNAS